MAKNTKTLKENSKQIRTPVVAVMGHVDHGKTSFLDAVRGTRVADREAGGITQNTRAHEVISKSGFKITFIDTPGHEAFSSMRERGARVTDFVLLIVAADDGVQPQTKESIEFAKKDKVPVILAINKVDIKGVKVEKIKSELSSYGVVVEEYGGDTLAFEISAKEKTGLDELLDGIQLLSEVNELSPRPVRENTLGEAFVLESNLDKQIGNVALCILKAGNLSDRFFGVTKSGFFKVRAYLDHNQKPISQVQESQPFWVTGLKSTLAAGEILYFVESEDQARYLQSLLEKELEVQVEESPVDLEGLDPESLFAQMLIKREEIKQGLEKKELNVIVKASTEGTLEAVVKKLTSMGSDEATVKILTSGTGDVTEDEINRAKLAKGIIVTFQLPTSSKIQTIAKTEKVLVRNYEVIYELFDEVQQVLESMEEPITEEVEVSAAKVKQIFTLSNGDIVIGSEVTKGTMLKGYRVKVMRGENEIGRGKISSLRIRKDEVKEVKKGLECGIVLDLKVEGIEEGDTVVAFKVETY
jgi:translation initiation factor IF-2